MAEDNVTREEFNAVVRSLNELIAIIESSDLKIKPEVSHLEIEENYDGTGIDSPETETDDEDDI